jgi:hypothetical protein
MKEAGAALHTNTAKVEGLQTHRQALANLVRRQKFALRPFWLAQLKGEGRPCGLPVGHIFAAVNFLQHLQTLWLPCLQRIIRFSCKGWLGYVAAEL